MIIPDEWALEIAREIRIEVGAVDWLPSGMTEDGVFDSDPLISKIAMALTKERDRARKALEVSHSIRSMRRPVDEHATGAEPINADPT